jgi:hypothetical protein
MRGVLRQACGLARAGQFVAQRLGGDASSLVDQEEVDRMSGAGMRQWPPGCAVARDPVQDGDGLLVQRDHPFAGELAQRHLQPGVVSVDLVHAVQFQVPQFPDPQAGGPDQQQRVGL